MLSVSFGPDSHAFWLVLDPEPWSTLDDIVIDCSLRKLGELLEAGDLEGRNPDLHAEREEAEADGRTRLAKKGERS